MEYYDPETAVQIEQILQTMREDTMVKLAEMLTMATGDADLANKTAETLQDAFETLTVVYNDYLNEFDPVEKKIKLQEYKRGEKIVFGGFKKICSCLPTKRKGVVN